MPDGTCFNPEVEKMPLEKLRQIENERLQQQIAYVMQNSTFYQQKYAEEGVDATRVKNVEDLPCLPFTDKDELRRSQEIAPPLGLHAAVPLEKTIRIHSSSGTTGRPSYMGITRRDFEIWREMVARVYYAEGVRPETIVIHGFGLGFFVGGLPLKDAIEHIGATFVPIGTGATERLITSIKDIGADYLTCTPSYAIFLAEYMRQNMGMQASELGIKRVACGAEPGGGIPHIRNRIAEEWGAVVTEGMGNADMAPVIFGECGESEGQHFCGQGFVYCELIDPESGALIPMEDEAEGELVYTSIERECVPLLRFRTHDHVKVWTGPCSCGRTSFRLRCIGRTDDMLLLRGVNVFPSAIKDVVTSFRPRVTGEIQVLLRKPGPSVDPPLEVKVEYDQDEDLPGLKTTLEKALREKLIFSAKVELIPAGTLPRFEMKAKLIERIYENQ